MENWVTMDKLPDGWVYEHPVLFANKDEKGSVREAFRDAGGCKQRDRSRDHLQSGYYDVPHYQRVLMEMYAQLPTSPCIVDLGCGDGRFSKLVLGLMSDAQVIAVDFNASDLLRLWEALDAPEQQRTTLVCASVDDLSPWGEIADAVILSEVAYTLENPLTAYQGAANWLKPVGLAMVSNVAKQAYFVHALLNGDWQQIERIVSEGKYVDVVRGQTDQKVEVHLYDGQRMIRDAQSSGFDVMESWTLPAEPGLMLHAMRARHDLGEDKVDLLAKAAGNSIGIDRIYISLLQKVV